MSKRTRKRITYKMTCEFRSGEKETEMNVRTKFKKLWEKLEETAGEKLKYYDSDGKEMRDDVSPAEFRKRLKIEQVNTRGGTAAILLIELRDAPTMTTLKQDIIGWVRKENIWIRKKEEKDLGHGLQQTFVGYLHSLHPERANRSDVEAKIHAEINKILKDNKA